MPIIRGSALRRNPPAQRSENEVFIDTLAPTSQRAEGEHRAAEAGRGEPANARERAAGAKAAAEE